jgi:hypothetical protein
MIRFTATIQKFDAKGGWMYIVIPVDLAQQLKPGNKRSFRVKGKLDDHPIEHTALLPIGNGDFMLPINEKMRKSTGKKAGAKLQVQMKEDPRELPLDADLMACLEDEPGALDFFRSLPGSHQRYFSKWVQDARTDATRTKRITQSVTALCRRQNYSEMMRSLHEQRNQL